MHDGLKIKTNYYMSFPNFDCSESLKFLEFLKFLKSHHIF